MEYFNKYFIDIITKKYLAFDGRARRQEYWFFALFYFIISIIVGVVDGLLGLNVAGTGLLTLVLTLGLLLPSIAVGVRRLHDIDKSGWWMIIGLIPLIGAIVLIVFFCLKGTDGSNRFGADPIG